MKVFSPFRSLLLLSAVAIVPAGLHAQISIGVSINIAPPVMPVYVQPVCPEPNLMWAPGYWGYDPSDGYYWVPGTWVPAPQPGLLWTPGYWGYAGGHYAWSEGYWGPHVGYYGGVNYGFGFYATGFVGGEWRGNTFAYNTAVMSVNTTVIHTTYINRTVINTTVINNHTSFNGPGGVTARPTPQEETYSHESHTAPSQVQVQHVKVASQDRENFASVNHGVPAHAATARPAASVAELKSSAVDRKSVV